MPTRPPRKARRTVCVLASGGLDSAMLIGHYLERGLRVWPVYLAGGLRWERAELRWLRRFLAALRSPRLEPLRVARAEQADLYLPRHWALRGVVPGRNSRWDSVYLEGRNLLLLSKVGVLCAQRGVGRIALGTLKGNPFLDARPRFLRAMENALATALGQAVRIEAPFRIEKKPALVRRHARLPLGLSLSCIRPAGHLHCGRCHKCFERQGAFHRARVADPTRYAA